MLRFPLCGRRSRAPALWALPVLVALAGIGEDVARADGAAVTVTYVEVESRTVELVHTTLGTVHTRSDPEVTAEVPARVEQLAVNEGEPVAAGDLIVELDDEDYEIALDQAQTEIQRLQARIRVQEATVARNRVLRESDNVSAQAFDEAQAELDALREQLAGARLAHRAAQRDLDRTRIRAPVDGVVERRLVSEGDYVSAGTPLYHVAGLDRLTVRAGFPETLADDLRPGLRLNLHNRSAREPGAETRITEVRPMISEGGRAVHVISRMKNPGGWRPGASVNTEVVLDERENVTVPLQALVRRPDGDTVYVLDEDMESVEARLVTTGRRTAEWVEIRDGLEPGEAVAVDGAGFLTDGAGVSASPHGD